MLSAQGGKPGGRDTVFYFKVVDAEQAHTDLGAKGVHFEQLPHVIGRTLRLEDVSSTIVGVQYVMP